MILLCSPKWFDGSVHFNKKSRFLRCSLGIGLTSKGRYDIKMQRLRLDDGVSKKSISPWSFQEFHGELIIFLPTTLVF